MFKRLFVFSVFFFIILTQLPIFSNPVLDYRVFKTKYVDIIYQKGLEASIYDFVNEIDELYESITSFYGIYPDERLRVIITDDTDIPNAFAIPFDDSIHIYACGNSGDEFSSDYKNWYRFVFTHEFTHIILGNYYNPYYSALRVFGNPLPSLILNSQIPLYLHEGISVFTESKFNGGFGRLNDARFEMYLRGDVLSGKFKGLELAGGYISHRQWAPGGMMYEYGASLVQFISRYYGESAINHLLYEFFKSPSHGLVPYIEKISGKDFRSFVEIWKKYEKAKADEIKRWVNYNIQRTGDRLTYSGWWTGVFDISREGLIYYFEDSENSESTINVLNLKTGKKRKLFNLGKLPRDVEVSPSGRHIALVVNSKQYFNLFSFNELIIYDILKKKFLNLKIERVISVDWLDEENLILLRNENGFRKIQQFNLKDGSFKTILNESRGIFINSIACSKDSIYFSGSFMGQNDLFVLKLSDGSIYRLTNDISNDLDPEISEDGKYLCFISDTPHEKYNIFNTYIIDIEGQNVFRVTNVLYGTFKPKFYKTNLIYRGYTPNGYDLFFLKNPLDFTYKTNKKLDFTEFEHVENVAAKKKYVKKNSMEFSNYIKPRIWMFLPYLFVTEDSAQFMIYQFNALWDTFVENLILSYGVFRTSGEPLNLSLVFIGKELFDYFVNLNFKYSFEKTEGFESSMNGNINLEIPFGNPLKPVIFLQKTNILMSEETAFKITINPVLAFDQAYNRYFGRFWRTSLVFLFDPMNVENWTVRSKNSFVSLKTLWNFETALKKEAVSFSLEAETPIWIIDKGTSDGRYSIGSLDFWTQIGGQFSSGMAEPNGGLGFKINFSLQYYVELETKLGIKFDANGIYPYFQLSPKILDIF